LTCPRLRGYFVEVPVQMSQRLSPLAVPEYDRALAQKLAHGCHTRSFRVWVALALLLNAVAAYAGVDAADDSEDEPQPAAEAAQASTVPTTSSASTAVTTSPLDKRNKTNLPHVLSLFLRFGRNPRIAKKALAQAYQVYRITTASYHVTGIGVVTSPDSNSLSLTKKLSDGASVSASVNHPVSGPDFRMLSVNDTLFLNHGFDLRVAKLVYDGAKENYRFNLETFKLQAIQTFFALISAQENLVGFQDQVRRTTTVVDITRAQFELGVSSKLDVLDSEVQRANAENALLQQRQLVDLARDTLLNLLDQDMDLPLYADDPLTLSTPERPDPSWHRSDLDAARIAVQRTRAEVDQARYLTYPNIQLGLAVNDATVPEVSATAAYNFPIGTLPVDHTYRALKHTFDLAVLAYQNLKGEITISQRNSQRTLKTQRDTVRITEKQLQSARESFEGSKISFERGILNNLQLRQSESNLTNARQAHINALISYQLATYAYRFQFGGTL
jgi:hypothetical protein